MPRLNRLPLFRPELRRSFTYMMGRPDSKSCAGQPPFLPRPQTPKHIEQPFFLGCHGQVSPFLPSRAQTLQSSSSFSGAHCPGHPGSDLTTPSWSARPASKKNPSRETGALGTCVESKQSFGVSLYYIRALNLKKILSFLCWPG